MNTRPDWDAKRIGELVRIAPYLGIEEVREAMVERAKVRLEHANSPNNKLRLEEFISGEGHVLPDFSSLVTGLRVIMLELGEGRGAYDHSFDAAYNQYVHYFFLV